MRAGIFVLVMFALLLPSFAGAQNAPGGAPVVKAGAGVSSSAASVAPFSPDRLGGFKEMLRSQRAKGGMERGGMGGLSQLNLTPEQQKKVDEIMANSKKMEEQSRAERQESLKKLRELRNAPEFNEAEFRKTHQKLAKMQEDREVNRAKVKMEIKKVLTPEQKEKYQKSQEEMQRRAFDMQGALGQGN